IDDILTFSQLQTGKLALSARPFDFRKLLGGVTEWTADQAGAKGVRIELRYPEAAARIFGGDEACIGQILRHLCDNAVKFTDAGQIRISFDCALQPTFAIVTVTVEDTGIGIAPNAQKLIFERFTQADGSLTRQRGGTGLGLAIVNALVGLMGGHVGMESRVGEGSRFWFDVRLDLPDEVKHKPATEIGRVLC
ncbi:MAG: sensor histidine kinase, partial [Bryobacteraceae bacterium]